MVLLLTFEKVNKRELDFITRAHTGITGIAGMDPRDPRDHKDQRDHLGR